MTKIKFTRADIEAVYNEVDRRIKHMTEDGEFEWVSEIVEYRNAMLQGVYGTLMVQAANWPEVVGWSDVIEEERYTDELVAAGRIKPREAR